MIVPHAHTHDALLDVSWITLSCGEVAACDWNKKFLSVLSCLCFQFYKYTSTTSAY